MKSNIDAACRQRIWPTAKRELKGKEGMNEWKLTLAWYVISFVTYGILKRIPNCEVFSFTLIQSECVGNVEAVRGIVLCKCLTRRKEIYIYCTVSTEGTRVMCVLGSFPSSRVPKPTRPVVILRCLRITGIPRKKPNKAEVVFCHILDVTRTVTFCFPYTWCCVVLHICCHSE